MLKTKANESESLNFSRITPPHQQHNLFNSVSAFDLVTLKDEERLVSSSTTEENHKKSTSIMTQPEGTGVDM